LAGANRFEVAVNAAKDHWPGLVGIQHVIIVSGEDRALCDALSAAGLAGVYDAPILLTVRDALQRDEERARADAGGERPALHPRARRHRLGLLCRLRRDRGAEPRGYDRAHKRL